MIRVLLVDDERLIRIAVRSIVDWNALGYEIIGEASNGLEALEMAGSLQPDLILLDINIPVIDGLKVCRSLKERGNPARIIILTGYDTFEYARTCIRLGVLDYLVKPLFREDVEKCLLEARALFASANEETKESEKRSVEKRLAETVVHDDMVHSDPVRSSACYYFALVRPDAPAGGMAHGSAAEKIRAAEISEWLTGAEALANVFSLEASDTDDICLLLSQWNLDIKFRLKELQKSAQKHSVSVSICVITDPVSIDHLDEVIARSRQELKNTFYSGPNSFFETSLKEAEKTPERPVFDFLAFHQYLNTQPENLLQFMKQELEKVMSAHPSREHLLLYSIRIINAISDYAQSIRLSVSDSLRNNLENISFLNQCHYAEQLYRYILETCRYLLCDLDAKKQKKTLIEETIRYIDLHYTDPSLSLSDIAKYLFVTPSYLSRIFKREMAVTVTEYITAKRIDQAFLLIMTGKYTKVSEVARLVGYSDSLYFSKTFKKLRGLPPSKYFA